ncbi:Ribokinase-like protein [Basidiobolus meristosporus CBS 931.73]|uniref:Ribokinase n=1 Tax=Basidiobolus meristosporus CBS 931.73 TaxID=1314790 RepID=A0A1Y1YEF3_9FUNG|nr:Ribokinase-like protein [Basidiobolus meristosporus CBS 931.73]|eukprot:ORX96420.1 Ribokinase-like protein [Basidiobolus meristosporus CBS 931.73]
MPKILCLGSVNIDTIYFLPGQLVIGETVSSHRQFIGAGGKGANQCAALAKAGAEVYMGGKIGKDGVWIKEKLESMGVNTKYLLEDEMESTGRTVIMNSASSKENTVVFYPGTNYRLTEENIQEIFNPFHRGDWLLLQDEVNMGSEIVALGKKKGMTVVFNAAPINRRITQLYPLNLVDVLILNEIEARGLYFEVANEELGSSSYGLLITKCYDRYPNLRGIVITLGSDGVIADFKMPPYGKSQTFAIPAVKTEVKDTTAAGDTFIGYLVATLARNDLHDVEQALIQGVKAASVAVSREGAMDSIPNREEV